MTISETIKEYRTQQGITQIQLAERINKSVRMIRHYESGTVVPSVNVLEEILNISIHDILFKLITDGGIEIE